MTDVYFRCAICQNGALLRRRWWNGVTAVTRWQCTNPDCAVALRPDELATEAVRIDQAEYERLLQVNP